MRTLLLSLLALVATCGSDSSLTTTGEHALNKRRDLDPQTCVDNFDIHRDKIIRTEDSREMGAKYLNEIDLGSRDECLRLCCETETCDVFVFEEKSPGSCYLFHCGPPEDFKCKFTRHTNFSSAVLAVNRHLAELEDQIKLTKHEQDLASLRKQYQESVTTLKTTTTQSPVINHVMPNTIPVQRCSRYQFECHSSKECIAIYNACDGIPQCSDASDEAPELRCPATTTLPPPPQPNLPPRELLSHMPQLQPIQQYNNNPSEVLSLPKDIPVQHQSPFLSPISSQEGPQWPRRLEQMPQNNPIQHVKQYNDNLGGSHIFNHKGGLQVTETDSVPAPQYDYKPMPYDSMPETNWQHRPWQQTDPNNMNDGSPVYHMDIGSQNSWKQQQMAQNVPNPRHNPNIPLPEKNQPDKVNIPGMPNMFQDRDKMWAVPQLQNNQEIPQTYTQAKISLSPEEAIGKNKMIVEKENNQQSNDKTDIVAPETDVESNDSSSDDSAEEKDKVVSIPEKPKDNTSNKKHNVNKTKKKHLKSEDKSATHNDEQNKETPLSDQIIINKLFDNDVHDGAAERPPGAILLLTLGVCMTSIMLVLLGCRLKMARRRMRRMGKSPFAHDADYLVNGMYL